MKLRALAATAALDVTTDAAGNGSTTATQDFANGSAARPESVIIHASATGTGTGDAGRAGDELGCVSAAL